MGGAVKNLVKDNVLAVGDAGGLVMPSNGGGISQAIMSGFYAGEAVIQHFNNGMELQNYHRRTMNVMKKSLKASLRTKKIAYLILRWNWSAELAMRFLGPIGGIRRAVECKKSLWII
jgi:digeranylgeranylglycerophospholipid reductase